MKHSYYFKIVLFIAIAAITLSCSKTEEPAPTITVTPLVTKLSPTTVAAGARVKVTGINLERLDSAKLGNLKLVIDSNASTVFTFRVPGNAKTGKLKIYNYGQVDSSKTLQIIEFATTKVSPRIVELENSATLTGTSMEFSDSIKLGNVKLDITNRSSTAITFKISKYAFSGKLYVYNANYIDSSQSLIVNEPIGSPFPGYINCLIDGVPFESIGYNGNATNNSSINLVGFNWDGSKSISLTIPRQININSIIMASLANEFSYSFPSSVKYLANGEKGTSGTLTITDFMISDYCRGTFNFKAKNSAGKWVKITNGRFAINRF